MTYYHIQGVPVWRYVARFLIPVVLLLIGYYSCRAVVSSRTTKYSVTLMPPDDRGTYYFADIKNVEYYSQSDPRWAAIRLGASGRVVLDAGDSLLAAAMAFNLMGVKIDPRQLAEGLPPAAFKETGELIWSKALEHPLLKEDVRLDYDGRPSEDRVEEALAKRKPTLLLISRTKEEAPHWALLAARSPKCYMVIDPIDGKLSLLSQYRNAARWQVSFLRFRKY